MVYVEQSLIIGALRHGGFDLSSRFIVLDEEFPVIFLRIHWAVIYDNNENLKTKIVNLI